MTVLSNAGKAVVRISDYNIGDLACYVPPDNVLPDKPEYAFLKGKLRIKSTKLRGIVSQGLLLPCPGGAGEGDDVAAQIGITHYVPRMTGHGSGGGGFAGDQTSDPAFPGQKWDDQHPFWVPKLFSFADAKNGWYPATASSGAYKEKQRQGKP